MCMLFNSFASHGKYVAFSFFVFIIFFMPRHKKWRGCCYTFRNFECPSVRQRFHHSCLHHKSWYHQRYSQQTSHKCKALWDDVQKTLTVTLVCLLFGVIALWTLNKANSTMYSCSLCKLKTVWDFHETSDKFKGFWDNMQNMKPLTLVNLFLAHLSKSSGWAIVITLCPSSVVRRQQLVC